MRILTVLGVLWIAFHGALFGRTWTDKTGRKLEAEWVSENETEVTLAKPGGEKFTYPIAKLSEADQDFLKGQRSAPTTTEPSTLVTETSQAPAIEHFPVFDYNTSVSEDASQAGYTVHRWAMLEVISDQALAQKAFEKAMRPLLGMHRLLIHLGLPPESLRDKECPIQISLYRSQADVSKAYGRELSVQRGFKKGGRMLATLSYFQLDSTGSNAEEPSGEQERKKFLKILMNQQTHEWSEIMPGWLRAAVVDYARMLPWVEDWPQPAHASLAMRDLLKQRLEKKAMLLTPALIERSLMVDALPLLAEDLSKPRVQPWVPKVPAGIAAPPVATNLDEEAEALHAAALAALFYLRHVHEGGKGEALKTVLLPFKDLVAARKTYMAALSEYTDRWDQILADPATRRNPDGSYLVPASYGSLVAPVDKPDLGEREAARHQLHLSFMALLGNRPGETVIRGLHQAGLHEGIAEDTGTPVGSPGIAASAKDFTPDYSKAVPAKPHAPLNQRQWPVEIAVGTGLVNPILLRNDTTRAVYRLGKFEFETGPGLSEPLVKEIARTFVAVGELIERLPWEMPPVPPKGDYFIARLYPKRSDYDAIAPPSSGGFYSLQEKVFHVPYESLGISQDSGGKWTKARDLNSDTLVHELTHMMMDRIIRHVPLWVTEGAAEYVETIPFENGVMRTGMLPKALKDYITHMESMPARARTQYTFKASARTLVEILHLSAKQWHQRTGTEPPTPIPGRVQLFLPLPGNEIAARQHDLYMHACLLFYYFMHLDSPQRGDPMLLLFDRALDATSQWRLYDEAMDAYRTSFAEYERAWEAFSQLPGVTKQSNGSLQYPATMSPPQAPQQPRPPVGFNTTPDQDLGQNLLPLLIKGRSDEQLQQAFRDGFAKIGIALQ